MSHEGDDSAGRVKPTTSPPPARGCAKTLPACRSAARRTAARPIPEPRDFVEKVGLEEPPRDVFRHTRPVVRAREAHGGRAGGERRVPHGEPDAAGRGADRLDRVHEEVRQGVADEEGIGRERVKVRIGLRLDRERLVRPEVGGDLLEEPSHGRAIEHAPLTRRRVAEPPEPADAVRQDSDLPEDSRRDVPDRARRRRLALRLVAPEALGREADRRERVLDVVRDGAGGVDPRREPVGSQEVREVFEEEDHAGRALVSRERDDRHAKETLARGVRNGHAQLVGRQAHGRVLESRAEGRPARAREPLGKGASRQQAVRRRIREEDGSIAAAEQQDGRREIAEKADGRGALLGQRLRALLDTGRHLGERVDEACEIQVGRLDERRQRAPLPDVRRGRDELLERPPQGERRPAAEAHRRERDRHREQEQRIRRRPHGFVLGNDHRERLAPVRRHGLRGLHDARRSGRERDARREGRRPPFRELLRDRGGEPLARHFRRDGQRARRGDERPVAIAQEVPADDRGSAIQRTFRRNGSAGLVSLEQAPALGNHVARAPRRLLRGVAFERDPHEHDADGERKGAEDQDERDQPGAERREEATREARAEPPARRAEEKQRNEDDESRLSGRDGGPGHRERSNRPEPRIR